MSAIGRKFEGSVGSSFLNIRIVLASFQHCGMFSSRRQRLKMRERMVHCGSTLLRWVYSTRSGPGDVLAVVRSLVQLSSAVISSTR